MISRALFTFSFSSTFNLVCSRAYRVSSPGCFAPPECPLLPEGLRVSECFSVLERLSVLLGLGVLLGLSRVSLLLGVSRRSLLLGLSRGSLLQGLYSRVSPPRSLLLGLGLLRAEARSTCSSLGFSHNFGFHPFDCSSAFPCTSASTLGPYALRGASRTQGAAGARSLAPRRQ